MSATRARRWRPARLLSGMRNLVWPDESRSFAAAATLERVGGGDLELSDPRWLKLG